MIDFFRVRIATTWLNQFPRTHILSSFLIGGMNAGAAKMQFDSGVAAEIIQVVQALVLAFVAAPEIIRLIYRYKAREGVEEATQLSTGWGSN